jgi:long-chain acyl-CoA synthetase
MDTRAAVEENLLNRITLGDTLHRSARKFGERTALIEGAQRMTYAQLDAATTSSPITCSIVAWKPATRWR